MQQLPTKEQILQWITDNPGQSAKRDIAKAFSIKGAARIELKRLLAELEEDGALEKKKRAYRDPGTLLKARIHIVRKDTADWGMIVFEFRYETAAKLQAPKRRAGL